MLSHFAAMRTIESSLNPYAASYVPLSKGGGPANENKFLNSTQELKSGNEAVGFGHQSNTLTQSQHQNVSSSQVHYAGALHTADLSKRKDHRGGAFYASTSHYSNEKPEKSNFDEEFDMDLAYLQMTFPELSHESLSNVYLASRCDLDSAVDMLDQLEPYPDYSLEKLPDTLDIGDVPEPSSSVELAPQKLKSMTPEAGASTSGSSNLSSAS